ncbi:hypothetical protein L6164_017950 [Bauhinia variegata]|uniref:Uncharacterized protein n=1 Tax=Bauhinia variegata TaxID=167791 RepID=A0ACB9N9G3_BAUVA|nr:hypothetical protein L6164_017950 [Bauhinia variegata]
MLKTTHHGGARAAAIPIPNHKSDIVSCPIPSLQPYRHDPHHRHPAITPPFMVTVVAATSSWLRNRRIRYLFLILCSPILLLLLCAALPFICVAELCLRRRIWRKLVWGLGDDDRWQRCEEGNCRCGESEGVGLLQRYLEDQLLLVGSVYECGDEEDDEVYQFKGVEDVENPGACRTPLLS